MSWGLHETKVLAIRGGTEAQRKLLAEHAQNSRTFTEKVANRAASLGEQFSGVKFSASKADVDDEDEEEKEICTVCWACQNGSTIAAGYVDGDIWLWTVPSSSKEGDSGDHSDADLPFISGTPSRKIDLVPGKSMKMPVILLKWCESGKGGKDAKDAKGTSGQLVVYGGTDLNATQALTVSSHSVYHFFPNESVLFLSEISCSFFLTEESYCVNEVLTEWPKVV